MISYLNHEATDEIKAHTDIKVNGNYIGYYTHIEKGIITAFFEFDGEMYSGEFKTVKQLESAINKIIK